MSGLRWGRLVALSLSACVLSDVSLEGRACPCLDGWVCSGGVCVSESEPPPAGISAPQQVALTRSRTQSIVVELTGAPCVVSLVDLPSGVSASPPQIALSHGNPSQTIVLSTSDDAALGEAASAFELRSEARPDLPSRVPLRVSVTGRPGTLDPFFGDGGISSIAPWPVAGLGTVNPNAKLVQRNDGSFIVAWTTTASPPTCRLARLDRSGVRDDTFAPRAPVLDDPGGCTVRAMTLAPDDSILLATTPPALPDAQAAVYAPIVITRFGRDGVDVTFGDGGTVRSAARTSESLTPTIDQRLSATSLGAVVVSGSRTSQNDVFDVARYEPGGRPDPTFGDGGVVTRTDVRAYGTSMLQPDGHVLVPAWTLQDFLLLRLDPSGATDTHFGDGGVLAVPRVQGLTVERVGVAPDQGDIVIAGSRVFRFDRDGVDAGTASVSDTPLIASDIAFARGQAHLVLESPSLSLATPSDKVFFLARLTPDGAPDEELGPGGRVEIAQPGYHRGMSLVVQDDGAWVVATRLAASSLGRDASGDPELVVERFFR